MKELTNKAREIEKEILEVEGGGEVGARGI